MQELSDRRLAENEVIFKQLNTEIKDFVIEDAPNSPYANKPLRFYCECSNLDCRERIPITAQEYDKLHKNNRRFILKPSHYLPEIEKIVERGKDFIVVEKLKVPPLPKQIDPARFF